MKNKYLKLVWLAVTALTISKVNSQNLNEREFQKEEKKKLASSLLKKSLNKVWIEENLGQLPANVQYGFLTTFGAMYVEKDRLKIVAKKRIGNSVPEFIELPEGTPNMELQSIDITFVGGSTDLKVKPINQQPTRVNYYSGNDRSKWVTGAAIYGELLIENIYPGVDLRLYSNENGHIEFDWILERAADYEKIRMKLVGQDGIKMTESGGFAINTHMGDLEFRVPESYQIIASKQHPVSARYFNAGDGILGFQVFGIANPEENLVIDPTVLWGTFFDNNSSSFDAYSYAVDIDSCGFTYVAATVNESIGSSYRNSATGYSTSYSASCAIFYRMNPLGTQILNFTYYDQNDAFVDIALFPDGRVLAGGYHGTSGINNYPTINAYYGTGSGGSSGANTCATCYATVVIFPSNFTTPLYSSLMPGDIVQSTLNLTGSSSQFWGITSVDVAGSNEYYLAGISDQATPTNFLTTSPAPYDNARSGNEAYIARFSGSNYNTRDWATYIGGDNDEKFISIKLTADKQYLCFAGQTHNSSNAGFPTLVRPIDSTWAGDAENWFGTIVNSSTIPSTFTTLSYLGGSGNVIGSSLWGEGLPVLDCDTNCMYIATTSTSTNFPGIGVSGVYDNSHNGEGDIVISKVAVLGNRGTGFSTFRSTYIGGTDNEVIGGIVYNTQDNNLYYFGTTESNENSELFPKKNTSPASNFYDSTYSGGRDICIGTINKSLSSLIYSSYIGGSSDDYLGSTGLLRGSGHYAFNKKSDIYALTTTVHSDVSGSGSNLLISSGVFDATKSNSTSDGHLLIKMNLSSADLGDVPSFYEFNNPAKHLYNPRLSSQVRFGNLVDADLLNQPNDFATGDDNNVTAADPCAAVGDDEDAIAVGGFPTLTVDDPNIGPVNYSVTLKVFNNTGSVATLYAWIDFDDSGVFSAKEIVIDTVRSRAGATTAWNKTITWNFAGKSCPVTIAGGRTYARIRIGTKTFPTDNSATWQDERANGIVDDGEVEDYYVNIRARDYGDLPNTGNPKWPVASAIRFGDFNEDNVPDDADAVWAGNLVDIEKNCTALANATASADDNNQLDDEDGLTFPGIAMKPNTAYNFTVKGSSTTLSKNVFYGVWFDMNGDGDWKDAGIDQFVSGTIAASSGAGPYFGTSTFSITTPANIANFSRLKLASRLIVSASALTVADSAKNFINGEIEDYIGDYAPSISGNVFNDQNGTKNAAVDGAGLRNPSGTQLWAYAINTSGIIADSLAVRTDGSFDLLNVAYGNTYIIKISSTRQAIGTNALSMTANLPSLWYSVSEQFGSNNGAGTGIESGYPVANMIDTVIIGLLQNVQNVNFGIDQEPASQDVAAGSQSNPGGTVQVTAPTLAGSDLEQGAMGAGKTIRIMSLPPTSGATAANVYYNGNLLSSGALPYTFISYKPSALTVDPIFTGAGTVTFTYVFVDSAGVADAIANTIVIPFTDPSVTISGTVFDDANGTFNNVLDGSGINKPSTVQLFAYLINSTNVVIDSEYVHTNGLYTLTAPANTSQLFVTITSTQYAIGATVGANTLPSDWINVGEQYGLNNAAGTNFEGTTGAVATDGKVAVTTASSNITVLNFGIDMIPSSINATATSQVNPGGTVQVTVPALTGSDLEEGSLGTGLSKTMVIETVPANANVFYNGSPVAAGRVISNYNSALLTVDPAFNGSGTVSFTYAWRDSAQLKDLSPATIIMPFTALAISGTVYHDGNGLVDALINGTPFARPNNTALFAYLVDGGNAIVDSSKINPNLGTYILGNVDANSTYNVRISTTELGIGVASPSAANLPGTWITTGEQFGLNNIFGSGIELGTPNGLVAITTGILNISNVNFGIEFVPISHNKTYQVNPDSLATITGNPWWGYIRALGLFSANGTTDTAVNSISTTIKPGKLSGFDLEDLRINGLTGSEPNAVIFNSLPDTSNAILAYVALATPIYLVPNPTIADPSFIYWNSTNSRYEIPNFDPNKLWMYFKFANQNSTIFTYSYRDAAGYQGTVSTYAINYSVPLPVVISNMHCGKNQNGATVGFTIHTPSEFVRIAVQRNTDGNWEQIGLITNVNVNASVQNFVYHDVLQSESNRTQYRIALTDKNGSVAYSEICEIRNNNVANINAISVKPNPTTGVITVSVTGSEDQVYSIAVVDDAGREIVRLKKSSINNRLDEEINLENCASGIYHVLIQGSGNLKAYKIVKL